MIRINYEVNFEGINKKSDTRNGFNIMTYW